MENRREEKKRACRRRWGEQWCVEKRKGWRECCCVGEEGEEGEEGEGGCCCVGEKGERGRRGEGDEECVEGVQRVLRRECIECIK